MSSLPAAHQRPPARWRRIAFSFVLLACALFTLSPLNNYFDQQLIDQQFRVLRYIAPKPAVLDVVLVGIDEATVEKIPEPLALWHKHFGKFFIAMAQAKAIGVGVDLIFPNRSFDSIVPGYDRALIKGLLLSRGTSQPVLGLTVEPNGKLRTVHPPLVSAAGKEGVGYVLWREDSDGMVRRFSENLAEDGSFVPTVVGQLARRMNLDTSPGIIDYSIGTRFSYIPLHDVLEWFDAGEQDKLVEKFGGKPVFLGSVLPFLDRLRQPIDLAAWEPGEYEIPGVLIHTQALRAMGSGGLIKPVPIEWVWLAIGLGCMLWFVPPRGGFRTAALGALLVIVAVTASTYGIYTRVYFPVSAVTLSGCIALWSRYGLEIAHQVLERQRLRKAFGSYVSPQILDQIVKGGMDAGLGGTRRRICILFADVRNFTTRSEGMEPEALIVLLNRYFEEVTTAIHMEAGTVDKFIGDGIMAFFGAPQTLPNPSLSAFNAAKSMLERVTHLNETLVAEGIPPIEIGIGLHYGDSVVGHVGSATRHEYTAIGDTVNLASRFESLTKEVGCPLLFSASVAAAISPAEGVEYLGTRAPKGHTAVEIYGWRPPAMRTKET